MKRRRLALAALALAAPAVRAQSTAAAGAACPALLQHTMNRLQDDKPQPLCQWAGKVLLMVNTASKCGYTPQYEGLEALHARYAPRGLVVMGFPSKDFGGQEFDSAKETADFCFNTYGVRFPMFSRTTVVGREAHPLFVALARAGGGAPRWNFHKYLVDRQGRVLAGYPSKVAPDDPALVDAIERALGA